MLQMCYFFRTGRNSSSAAATGSAGAVRAGQVLFVLQVDLRLCCREHMSATHAAPSTAAAAAVCRWYGVAYLQVAAAVGIPAEDVHAGIKPAGKAALVEALKAQVRLLLLNWTQHCCCSFWCCRWSRPAAALVEALKAQVRLHNIAILSVDRCFLDMGVKQQYRRSQAVCS